jgi:hypothetical protein
MVGATRLGTTKGLQAICIVSVITFTGSHQVSGNSFGATAPDAMLGAEVTTETPGTRALSAAVPHPSAGPGTALGSVSGPAFGTPLAKAEIGDCISIRAVMLPIRCRQRTMRPTKRVRTWPRRNGCRRPGLFGADGGTTNRLGAAASEARVSAIVAKSQEALTRARHAAVILAFMIGASLLIGAAIAWVAATGGGQHRGESGMPHFWRRWDVNRVFLIR